ncbi:hypothetical protein AB751O23_CO_00050, partial [Chlamydiales bacterium SCGC AB-751-O23]
RKLFIIMFDNYLHPQERHEDNLIEFNNSLSKHTNNYTLLVINHLKHREKQKHIFTKVNNIDFLELHTLSWSTGSSFANKKDDDYLNDILTSKYKFDLK